MIATVEYQVCIDCYMFIGLGDEDLDDETSARISAAIAEEVVPHHGQAHFTTGIEPTEEDPNGEGYEEFTWHSCELCKTTVAGSRHGVTLMIQREDSPC